MTIRSVCVFCGSSPGNEPYFKEAAEELCQLLAERQITLVYGGANVGIMGMIANEMLRQNAKVIGVIPTALFPKEIPHPNLTQLHVVPTMHERKKLMYDLADAFIVLPGGFGTLDEMFEVLTWGQLGIHQKPLGVLNLRGYYQKLLDYMENAIQFGFVRSEHRKLYVVEDKPALLLNSLIQHVTPQQPRWLGEEER